MKMVPLRPRHEPFTSGPHCVRANVSEALGLPLHKRLFDDYIRLNGQPSCLGVRG